MGQNVKHDICISYAYGYVWSAGSQVGRFIVDVRFIGKHLANASVLLEQHYCKNLEEFDMEDGIQTKKITLKSHRGRFVWQKQSYFVLYEKCGACKAHERHKKICAAKYSSISASIHLAQPFQSRNTHRQYTALHPPTLNTHTFSSVLLTLEVSFNKK